MKAAKSILPLVFTLILGLGTYAQNSKSATDKILLNNGKEVTGKVISNEAKMIGVKNPETKDTVYVNKTDITRIDYADGRVDQINFGTLSSGAESWEERMKKYKNKVAVLPFVYEDHYNKHEHDNMSLQTQLDCINNIRSVNDQLIIQHMDTTNMKLVENEIDWKSIKEYSPAEVADILEVEYIVYGTVEVEPIGKPNKKENSFGTENQTLETPQGRRENPSISPKKFETLVDINIYDILGETVYSNAHESFWQTPDAYNQNLMYLIEESPFNILKR